MDLHTYEQMLKRLDWAYQYSDDHSAWVRGEQALRQVQRIARESPAHAQLFREYSKENAIK